MPCPLFLPRVCSGSNCHELETDKPPQTIDEKVGLAR